MKYDPRVHHRRSIRLKGYDYSQSGAYFVTICTNTREMLLVNDTIQDVIQSTWNELPDRFTKLSLDEFIIMPNHVHGILVLNGPDERDHADVRHARPTLAAVVGAFKSISAIAANRLLGRSGTPFWQRNYYEHVIRSDEKLNQIRQYIRDNPAKWADDPNNPENINGRAPTVSRAVLTQASVGAGRARRPYRITVTPATPESPKRPRSRVPSDPASSRSARSARTPGQPSHRPGSAGACSPGSHRA